MSASDEYQAIVIGSGQGGNPLCAALAGAGLRTALIERKHVGGTCINEGCTPTKTMVASARVAYLARRAADFGVHFGSAAGTDRAADTAADGDIRVDMQRVRQRKRDIVNTFRTGSEGRIAKTKNLELILGDASFAGPKSVLVKLNSGDQRVLTGEKIFINAGARPSVPTVSGLKDVPFLDSTSIMELDAVPEHLIVLGGGYVGLEFGQMFRRFGSRVTIVQSGSQLMSREDADVAGEVAAILKQDGIDVVLNAKMATVSKVSPAARAPGVSANPGVSPNADVGTNADVGPNAGASPNKADTIRLTVSIAHQPRVIDGSHLLLATGRTPNTDSLNLAAAGVAVDSRGYIEVNPRLETRAAGIYALGDIKGGPAFTHISYDDFRILRTNLIEKGSASTDGRMVPYAVFIDPELGRIGLTEAQARAQNKKVRVAKMPMTYVARALENDETRGFMKAVVDADTGQILGAAVLGIEGGEIMSMLELAMMAKLPFTALREATLAHPTLAESLNNLFQHFE
jgi:pyruvate/2-oxoglutarate dehydrogenase complex dihydrolipoamide dehydrogenase (E3) component